MIPTKYQPCIQEQDGGVNVKALTIQDVALDEEKPFTCLEAITTEDSRSDTGIDTTAFSKFMAMWNDK